jgi:hypothetical protein
MQNRILKSLISQEGFKEGFKGSFGPLIIKVRDNLDSICANLRQTVKATPGDVAKQMLMIDKMHLKVSNYDNPKVAYLQYRIVELYIKRAYLSSTLDTLMPFAQSTLDTIKQN